MKKQCLFCLVASGIFFTLTPTFATAQPTETVLWDFTGTPSDTVSNNSPLFQTSDDSFYGLAGQSTRYTGTDTPGAFYHLQKVNGAWTNTILATFSTGSYPTGPLLQDSSGNFYGVTQFDGVNKCGSVFKLSQSANVWSLTTLYLFSCFGDGKYPSGGVVMGSNGSLYGSTVNGGTGGGVIYKLTNNGSAWSLNVVYSFTINSSDGFWPNGITLGPDEKLYGTTQAGGTTNTGTAFSMTLEGKKTILHNFGTSSDDGIMPQSPLLFVRIHCKNYLIGTTLLGGGSKAYGTIFALALEDAGWNESVIFSFQNSCTGVSPSPGRLTFDGTENVYGTTSAGLTSRTGGGTVFKLTPCANKDTWEQKLVYSFASGDLNANGQHPGSLIYTKDGTLYGITQLGGITGTGCASGGCGVIYALR